MWPSCIAEPKTYWEIKEGIEIVSKDAIILQQRLEIGECRQLHYFEVAEPNIYLDAITAATSPSPTAATDQSEYMQLISCGQFNFTECKGQIT